MCKLCLREIQKGDFCNGISPIGYIIINFVSYIFCTCAVAFPVPCLISSHTEHQYIPVLICLTHHVYTFYSSQTGIPFKLTNNISMVRFFTLIYMYEWWFRYLSISISIYLFSPDTVDHLLLS